MCSLLKNKEFNIEWLDFYLNFVDWYVLWYWVCCIYFGGLFIYGLDGL